ncbi:AAA family ATPase [Vibrio fluvialis]|uniref:AAA family ATPase n=1 Tax=Vibrio fluvialis TaxID=676 RepID=UPI001F24DFF0|nr:AAA family ATPase [Vibrio fluvialis]MCE7650314.1 CbbQ/NirQ/NorQ/GpvN family protein [Vibrio fluvialis]GIA96652.1 ATPase associated with various cellular activities AAA_5 [Vibrio cholerae]
MTILTLTPQSYPMDVFGFPGTNVTVEGFAPSGHPNIPAKKDYIFRRETLRDIVAFLDCSFGDGLMITGPTGCGKTSAVEQVLARLNYPAQSYTCGGSTEYMDLVGQYTLVNGNTVWMDGVLTTAMREGHVLILNEIDLVDPAELANLNAILEGAPLVITQLNGEIVRPHPAFRLIATSNSNGSGGDGNYMGVNRLNMAFMNRFVVIKEDYASEDTEMAVLEKLAPNIPKVLRKKMIELANKVRAIFKGEQGDSELSITFSTRTLIRWAILTQRFQGANNALSYALDRALLNRCSEEEERETIQTLAVALFGADFNNN